MNRFKIAVLVSGRGSNLQALLQAQKAVQLPFDISVVLSDNPEAPALEIAKAFNVPTTVVPRNSKGSTNAQFNQAIAEALRPYKVDLIVLAGFMRILTGEFIREYANRIINIHPSLLPSFPGLDVQAQALAAGVKFAGCTVHYVVEKVDAGPIIAQAVVPIIEGDTVETLSARILKQEHLLLPAAVTAIAEGCVRITENAGVSISCPVTIQDTQFLRSL